MSDAAYEAGKRQGNWVRNRMLAEGATVTLEMLLSGMYQGGQIAVKLGFPNDQQFAEGFIEGLYGARHPATVNEINRKIGP
jgi:hypothetical protein